MRFKAAMYKGFRNAQPLCDALQNMEKAADHIHLLAATLQSVGMSMELGEMDSIRNRMRSIQMEMLTANQDVMNCTNALINELKGVVACVN